MANIYREQIDKNTRYHAKTGVRHGKNNFVVSIVRGVYRVTHVACQAFTQASPILISMKHY